MRLPSLIVLATVAAVAAVAAGCGGDTRSSPPGSPEKPLVAHAPEPVPGATPASDGRSNDGAADPAEPSSAAPGYQKLLERQTSKPASRFTPCNLVSRAQASTIMGQAIKAPFEAPQGPTCIYRTAVGNRFVTVSVQAVALKTLRRQLDGRRTVTVGARSGLCGTYGHPMLYVALSQARVLSIAAPCDMARRFAVRAVRHLES
jgi:hypothetical protein